MKKIHLILAFLISFATFAQAEFPEGIQLTNQTSTTATKVNVQEADGVINTIAKNDLVNVVEVNDVPSLPLIGEAGKIYVVKNLNKIYRWNGTIYQELAYTGISLKADLVGGKVPLSQINDALLGSVNYKGTYNASTNSPTLPTVSSANKGWYYVVSTAGTQQSINFVAGDWILSNGTSWGKVDNNNNVTSVAGKVGAVTLVKADVGLSNVDNTSDINKPISTATQTALNLKENAFSKNTAFNKNFGTTSGTVVEGGTLGSNAYNSIAYLPLSGGALTGILNVDKPALQIVSEGSDQGAIDLLRTGDTRFRLFSDINGFGIYNFQSGVNNLLLNKTTGAATFSSTVTATSFNGSATLTGTPTAPTATPGTNTTQIATTAFVQANLRPYKVYTALLSQSGTNAPTAVVLENTLGTVTFTRSSNGVYLVNSSGLFTADKTFVIMGAGTNAAYTNAINLMNSSTFFIVTKESSTESSTDSANTKVAFEIRVYN